MFDKMNPGWKYQVREFGSALRSAKPQEVEDFLNEASAEGWELSRVATMSNGSKLMVILRRKSGEQRRKRKRTWPEW
jgi:hypothetical protein